MRRSLSQVAVVIAALLAGSAWGFQKGTETRSAYRDTVHGFTIEIPKFPGSARAAMRAETRLEIVPGATHLFEEPGALERVAELAREWFVSRFTAASGRATGTDSGR